MPQFDGNRYSMTHALLTFLAALTFVGCGPIAIGSDKCEVSNCSELATPESTLCADGTKTVPTGACVKAADGACAWEVTSCPAACKLGDSKPSGDGCNQCNCTAAGEWTCTTMACDTSCIYDGIRYADGTQFSSSKGCCKCAAGVVTCSTTDIACAISCSYEGKTYPNGATFPAIDGCNSCTCSNGAVGCTKMACTDPTQCTDADCGAKPHSVPELCSDGSTGGYTGQCLRDASGACKWEFRTCPTTTCTVDGKEYPEGSTFASGGDCCGCASGKVICQLTQAYCANACIYGNSLYTEGQSYPASDGCNTCTCKLGQSMCGTNSCTDPTVCEDKECGPESSCASYTCADGSVSTCTHKCKRDATGICSWETSGCPTTCQAGAQFTTGCKLCTCNTDNSWSCAELDPATCNGNCTYEGKSYANGEQFPSSAAGCCTCNGGKVECALTDIACPAACEYGGKTYGPGTTYLASDGCNTCTCKEGLSICSNKTCSGAVCAVDECKEAQPTGMAYQCSDGSLAGPTGICVRNSTGTCSWDNRMCATKCLPGEKTLSADGCSTCVCGDTGEFTCTQGQCPACAEGDPGFINGGCPACTVGANQTCNDEPMNSLAGMCIRNICSCKEPFGLNPKNGKCTRIPDLTQPVCTPNLDQTCNGNLEVSYYQGRCLFDGTCLCIDNNVLDTTTGKCVRVKS